MIKLFFKDGREPLELELDPEYGVYFNTDGFSVDPRDFEMQYENDEGNVVDITSQCSHIQFPNGKFIWEEKQ